MVAGAASRVTIMDRTKRKHMEESTVQVLCGVAISFGEQGVLGDCELDRSEHLSVQ